MSFKKSKSYGEVCGPGQKYKYVQNYKFYDQFFNEVTDQGIPIPGGEYNVIERRKPAPPPVVKPKEPPEFTGMSVDQMTKPQEADAVTLVAPENDGLSELTRKELFEQLERMGADKPEQNTRKDDLVAMLRDELKAKDLEGDE